MRATLGLDPGGPTNAVPAMDKREFLKTLSTCTIGALLGQAVWARYAELAPSALAEDEPFWALVRAKYTLKDEYINFENGYYSMQSNDVLEAFVAHVRAVNREAAHYMRTRAAADKLAVRRELAQLAGCSPDELIITRNTTESLDSVIAGRDWKPGDEALMAEQDYGAMLAMFAQEARRHGLVQRMVSLPLDPRDDDELVELYANAITPKTKLLMISHMVNITGQILPVRRICDMAHSKGVEVLVDGAHAFAHFEFSIPQLQCDYYGASLHKWLGCPLGAGILYVRKERVRGLWPMFGESDVADDDIAKLNHTGTHPVHTDLAIRDALTFHNSIGIQRKEARLRHLQRSWTTRVRGRSGITLNTPSAPQRACAIANVAVGSLTPSELARVLLERYSIYTVAIDRPGVRGVRVTPHIYTSMDEVDALVRALNELAAS